MWRTPVPPSRVCPRQTTNRRSRMDYELQRSTRKCAKSGRELAGGETFYSVLIGRGIEGRAARLCGGGLGRAARSWPSDGGNRKSPPPIPRNKKPHWAPNDVMLQLFDELAEQPDRADMRYVLALLLLRRRVLRLEDTEQEGPQGERLLVYCPRRQTEYKVPVVMPDGAGRRNSERSCPAAVERSGVKFRFQIWVPVQPSEVS